MEKYNEARQALAEEHQIANMHEFVSCNFLNERSGSKDFILIQKYDHGLEEDAKRIKTCEDFKHSYNFRIAVYYTDESERIWNNFSQITGYNDFRDYYHPLQTAFIYCELTTKCSVPYMGFNGTFQLPSNDTIIFGYR